MPLLPQMTSKKGDYRNIRVIQFLEAYERQESLWNPLLESYKNKSARDDAYKCIIDELKLPALSVNDVKLKVKSIRTTYKKEVRLLKKHREEGKPYNPKLYWFNRADAFLRNVSFSRNKSLAHQMMWKQCCNLWKVLKGLQTHKKSSAANIRHLIRLFLKEKRVDRKENVPQCWERKSTEKPILYELAKVEFAVSPRQSSKNLPKLDNKSYMIDYIETNDQTLNNEESSDNVLNGIDEGDLNTSCEEYEFKAHESELSGQTYGNIEVLETNAEERASPTVCNNNQNELKLNCSSNAKTLPDNENKEPNEANCPPTNLEDEYDLFCRSIAMQLRSIKDNYSRCVAKLKIQQILFEAETGHYKNNPCITIPVFQSMSNINNL